MTRQHGGAWFRFALPVLVAAVTGFAPLQAQEPVAKKPIPDAGSLQQALTLVEEVYGGEFKRAKDVAQKAALAEKLLQKANESAADPTGQYALLKVAKDIASLAGDTDLALRVVDDMAATFDINILPMKIETLLKTASCATSTEQHAEVVGFAEELRNDAVENDDFSAAARLGEAAREAAKKTGDRSLIRKLQDRTDEIHELAEAFAEIQEAVATLNSQPTDPAANLAVGKYLCFRKGRWERGLPMLSLGDDAQLRELALVELAAPSSADEQKQLGDRWWELAANEEGTDEVAQRQLQRRSRHWYQQALPGLTGLSKDLVEKRLATLPAQREDTKEGGRTATVGPLSARMMQHNRRVAEWVLSIGGSVEVRLQDQDSATAVKSLADLPNAVFVVTSVYLLERPGLADRNLAALVGLHHLRRLNLAGTQVSDAGMAYVGRLTSLEELYLGGTRVGDNGMRFVGNLTNLTFLGLFSTRVTDHGLRYLSRLQKLQRINVGGTKTSDAMLRTVFPNCAIERP